MTVNMVDAQTRYLSVSMGMPVSMRMTLYDQLRKYYWSGGSTLHSKLYRAKEELQTMGDFIIRTCLRV